MARIDPGPFAPHLEPGERLVWRGRPAQGWRLRFGTQRGLGREELLCLLVGIAFMGAGVKVLIESAARPGEGVLALLVALAGAALVVGPHWADMRRRARRAYALSDRRALILTGGHLVAQPLADSGPARLLPGDPGGVLVAVRPRPMNATALLLGRRMHPGDVVSFELIADAPRVLSLVRQYAGRAD
ncbi:hypothetical protein [Rhodobaculum claviforme]|uniref:Uncharacterized protein n=1 Tax=Rhodobaculum claviforme TaxID=1549854 RepID=A0A934TK25_9RHOB|nr:hypothetical protein [Rhodobaculum claviforme]MBK5927559.1 hypothetical protein [Rhodobaculum claviforme]